MELDAYQEALRDIYGNRASVTETNCGALEEGRACMLILSAELDRLERRLATDRDPHASFSALTDAFRRVSELQAHIEGLRDCVA